MNKYGHWRHWELGFEGGAYQFPMANSQCVTEHVSSCLKGEHIGGIESIRELGVTHGICQPNVYLSMYSKISSITCALLDSIIGSQVLLDTLLKYIIGSILYLTLLLELKYYYLINTLFNSILGS